MAYFDNESLFMNIPLNKTVNICVNVFNNKKRVKGLLKKQLLTLSVKSSCFVFNNVYYQQVDISITQTENKFTTTIFHKKMFSWV